MALVLCASGCRLHLSSLRPPVCPPKPASSPPSLPPRSSLAPSGGSPIWRLVTSRRRRRCREVEGEGIDGVRRSPDQRSRGGSCAADSRRGSGRYAVQPSKSLPGPLPLLSARRRIGWVLAVPSPSNDRASKPSRPTSAAPD